MQRLLQEDRPQRPYVYMSRQQGMPDWQAPAKPLPILSLPEVPGHGHEERRCVCVRVWDKLKDTVGHEQFFNISAPQNHHYTLMFKKTLVMWCWIHRKYAQLDADHTVCFVFTAVQEERQRGKERGESEVESTSSFNEEMPVDKILDAELAVEPKTETYSDSSPSNSVRTVNISCLIGRSENL